jgi:hypothetical protein
VQPRHGRGGVYCRVGSASNVGIRRGAGDHIGLAVAVTVTCGGGAMITVVIVGNGVGVAVVDGRGEASSSVPRSHAASPPATAIAVRLATTGAM